MDAVTTNVDTITGEVLPPATGLYAAVAAQIDRSISTARAFPRNMAAVSTELARYAATDDRTAEAAIYSLKRGNKTIQGPSARFAEMLAYAYGHLRIDARVVEEGKDYITVRGEAHDLQRNVVFSQDVVRRITDSTGKRYGVDMIGVTAMAAASIAQRDCILKVIPSFLWRPAFEAALSRITGDVKTLADRRIRAVGQFSVLGVTANQVFKRLGISGINDISPELLVELAGTFTAIRDGQTTVEAEFGDTLVAARSNGSPLAAPEDKGDAAPATPIEVAAPAPSPMDAPQPQAPAPQAARKPERSPKKAEPRPEPSSPYHPFDASLRAYEKECLQARSRAELKAIAIRWGELGVFDTITDEQKSQLSEIYEAAGTALVAEERRKKTEEDRKAYEAGRNTDAVVEAPKAVPRPTVVPKPEETPKSPPPQAPSAGNGSSERRLIDRMADMRPRDPEPQAIWDDVVLYLVGATDEDDLMARYIEREKDGSIGSLPEVDGLNMRSVRYRIKQDLKKAATA